MQLSVLEMTIAILSNRAASLLFKRMSNCDLRTKMGQQTETMRNLE